MDTALIQVLEQACSQDPKILTPAEQILKQWETERGLYTALFDVFSNHSLAMNVRWMAVLYFKNGVERYWRKTAPNAMAEDEKELLRQRLISNFNEPIDHLAIQIAEAIAKIARLDCPREWNTLIPTLLEAAGAQNSLTQHRAIYTLQRVVKTLASKRLLEDQQLFRELSSNISNFIFNLWNTFSESFLILASNGADVQQLQEIMGKAHLLLKILKHLTVHGFPPNSRDIPFLKVIFERARATLECRKTLISRGIHIEVCDKFLVHLTKVLLGVLEFLPSCYVEVIPTSLEFTYFYCFTEAGQRLTFERFTIQCLNILKIILSLKAFKQRWGATRSDPSKLDPELYDRVKHYQRDFFTDQRLTEICYRLVTHYFLLTPADLELWDTDPENFVIEEYRNAWKYSSRPCTKAIFVALIQEFYEAPKSMLMDLLQRHHQPADPNDLNAILLKDALYTAFGLTLFFLDGKVDFDQWWSTVLKQELQLRGTNYRIIRRRVCWLIGQGISDTNMSRKLKQEAYELIIQSLRSEEDLCIRLAASDALQQLISGFDFKPEDFQTYLESAFFMLCSLLKESNECDTKMRVLCGISFLIQRTVFGIKPYLNSFIAYLPDLWQQSEEHNMLRCGIVSVLVNLANALGSDCVTIEPLVVAVVGLSCDVHQDDHVYLLENGLELWLALLEATSTSSPGMMGLLKNMPDLFDCSSENLRRCMDIMTAYVVLVPMEFICEHGHLLIDLFKSRISDMRDEEVAVISRLFETCLMVLPQESIQLMKPILAKIFENVYKGTASFDLMLMSLCIMSRVLLSSKETFAQVISELARSVGDNATEESVLGQIIEVWVIRMTSLTNSTKLLSLGLCSLLSPDSPQIVFQHFPQMIYRIAETFRLEIEYPDAQPSGEQPSSSSEFEVSYLSEHDRRVDKLLLSDPAHIVSLKDTLQNQLITLRRVMGEDQFQQMLSTIPDDVDKTLLKEFFTFSTVLNEPY
ncbi:importin-11 isoform X2 [Venturia canescens]|nr:importin-11 isoform X2 [Venturia canescens]